MSEGLKKVRTSHRNIGGGSLQEEEDCKCKGPEAGMCLLCSRVNKVQLLLKQSGLGENIGK